MLTELPNPFNAHLAEVKKGEEVKNHSDLLAFAKNFRVKYLALPNVFRILEQAYVVINVINYILKVQVNSSGMSVKLIKYDAIN